MDDAVDVVVVGGGLAGLAAAARGSQYQVVRLLDGHAGANRAATDSRRPVPLQPGRPRPCRRVRGARCAATGCRGERQDAAAARCARPSRRRGRRRLPLGPVATLRGRLVPPRGMARLLRLAAGVPRWRPDDLADRTAAAWFDDLGLDGATRSSSRCSPARPPCAADLDRVSADLVALQIRLVLKGNVHYLHGGWQTLLDGLAGAVRRRGVERRRRGLSGGARRRAGAGDGRRVTTASG